MQTVLAGLSKKSALCAYVDLWPTDNEATFVTALAKAITQSMSSSVGKLLETGKNLFSMPGTEPLYLVGEGKPGSYVEVAEHPSRSGRGRRPGGYREDRSPTPS